MKPKYSNIFPIHLREFLQAKISIFFRLRHHSPQKVILSWYLCSKSSRFAICTYGIQADFSVQITRIVLHMTQGIEGEQACNNPVVFLSQNGNRAVMGM